MVDTSIIIGLALMILAETIAVKLIVGKLVSGLSWGRAVVVVIALAILGYVVSFVLRFAFAFTGITGAGLTGGQLIFVLVWILVSVLAKAFVVKIVVSMLVESIGLIKALFVGILIAILETIILFGLTMLLGVGLMISPVELLPLGQ